MKQYTKQIDGKAVVKALNEITIRKDGTVTYNPTEDMVIADGWTEHTPSSVISEERRAKIAEVRARQRLRTNIQRYDTSSEVNAFYVGDIQVWLDKATRAGLLLRFQAEQAQGLVSTSLWYNGKQFPLNVDQAIQMLYAVELYASACYDNAQRHLAAINALTTIEEMEAYDYKVGYPEKLHFL